MANVYAADKTHARKTSMGGGGANTLYQLGHLGLMEVPYDQQGSQTNVIKEGQGWFDGYTRYIKSHGRRHRGHEWDCSIELKGCHATSRRFCPWHKYEVAFDNDNITGSVSSGHGTGCTSLPPGAHFARV